MGYWGYAPYISVGEKRAKAARKLKQLLKKNPDMKPILLDGRSIAKTWWGKSWNINLERYADYSNRIGRGRSYVRHGAVLDLQIDAGKCESLVQGTRSKPYSVYIKIKPVNTKIRQTIISDCEGKLDSLQELLTGKFPKALGEIFTTRGKGLFPSPKEIDFHCSCPDSASMCKHVAATLYGIGARLDEDPALFFKLRKVKMKDLITEAVEDETRKLLKKAKKKSRRAIAESDLSDLFGLEMEDPAVQYQKMRKAKKRAPEKKKPSRPGSKKARAKDTTEKKEKKTASRTPSPPINSKSPYDTVVGVVRRSRKGVTVALIRDKTGFDDKQIRNFIYKAKRQGKIRNLKRAIYTSS